MATESAYSGDDPHQLLTSARDLAQRVRRAQRATWFPFLVFAAATFAATPVFRFGGHHPETCAAVAEGRICTMPIRFGWVVGSPWHFLPSLVIQGSVLLLGGIGFALAQRPARVPAA